MPAVVLAKRVRQREFLARLSRARPSRLPQNRPSHLKDVWVDAVHHSRTARCPTLDTPRGMQETVVGAGPYGYDRGSSQAAQ